MKKIAILVAIVLLVFAGCNSIDTGNSIIESSDSDSNISKQEKASSTLSESVSLSENQPLANDVAFEIFSQHPDYPVGYWKIPGYVYGSYPSEGLFWVCNGEKFGFLNVADLSIAIPLEYEACGDFFQGVACVKKNGKWGLIDKTNTTVLPFEYDYVQNGYPGLIITHPIERVIWNTQEISIMPDAEMYSYQIYNFPDMEMSYSCNTPVYSSVKDNNTFDLEVWISENKYPLFDIKRIDLEPLDINGLWGDYYTVLENDVLFDRYSQYENEPIYEVIVWDETIPYELIDMN